MGSCCLLPSLPIRALTLGSAKEFGADTNKKREIMPKSTQEAAPLQLQIAERAIVEIVEGKKLLHGTWNLRHNTLHRFAQLAGS